MILELITISISIKDFQGLRYGQYLRDGKFEKMITNKDQASHELMTLENL
jgi:hypothetical protein